MTWFTFSLFSIFAIAFAELTQQHLLTSAKPFSARTSAVLTFLFQSLLTLPLIFFLGLSDQLFSIFQMPLFGIVLFFSFFSSLSAIFYLKSLKVKNISLSAILISSSALISTPLGIIFFSESITLTKFFGILLILSAVFIAKFRNPIFEKNHIFGLIAGIMFGVAYVVDKGIVQHIHPLIYIFWSFLMISILGFLIGFQNVINSLKNRKLPSFKFLIFSGIGYFLFNLFTFKAYRVGGEVGRIDAINTAYIFIIIIFEYFILKHTRGITRKLIASALAALGVFILGNL